MGTTSSRRIASKHNVSANNVFALLWKIGQDCAGAVQFADPAVAGQISRGGSVEWIDEDEVAMRLARLRLDHESGRKVNEGQFSLAAAQPKIALLLEDGKWGVPSGRIPTTHILKPPISGLDGHAENEVFCLMLASKLGLVAAKAVVSRFKDELAIVVERFDRVRTESGVLRVHQEDLCQALAAPPSKKYEKDGGPGVKGIMDMLTRSTNAEADRRRFMRATILNFLIVGTDAHAKNYSLLFGPGQVRLAPIYDIASYLPYYAADGYRWQDVRMPMRVGYEPNVLHIRCWTFWWT
jgi:serine/threonine-protein kinase HipA